jgi:secondary thiamine-phosphate synthase enzyme
MKQVMLELPEFSRGFHLITSHILKHIDLSGFKVGLLHIFIQHTSASLTLNENISAEVRRDFERFANILVPEQNNHFEHVYEGSDDMPAHIKASVFGSSLLIPVSQGRFALGTWQGIYLCEHRDQVGRRSLVLTVWGEWFY